MDGHKLVIGPSLGGFQVPRVEPGQPCPHCGHTGRCPPGYCTWKWYAYMPEQGEPLPASRPRKRAGYVPLPEPEPEHGEGWTNVCNVR